MNFKYAAILLNVTQRYIAVHNNNHDPFESIKENNITEKQCIMQHNAKTWSIANLTAADAQKVKNLLQPGETLATDEIAQLANVNNNTNFLNQVPIDCNVKVNNIDLVVLDTTFYTGYLTEFDGINIQRGPSFTFDKSYCNPHGTQVAGVMAGKTGILKQNQGNYAIYVVSVFECNGQTPISVIIAAINWAIEFGKQQKLLGRKVIINFSAVSNANLLLNSAATAAVKNGIVFIAGAGNRAKDACNFSPASAKKVITVGSTQSPGDVIADFSNYGKCVTLFVPGTNICVPNPGGRPGKPVCIKGTSFSTPIVAVLVAMLYQLYPKATTEEIYKHILQLTTAINYSTASMRLITASNFCPDPLIWSSFKVSKNDNNLWWPFKVQQVFNIKTTNSKSVPAILFKYYNFMDNSIFEINKKFVSSKVFTNFNLIYSNNTLLLQYDNNKQTKNLVVINTNPQPDAISFSATHGSVSYQLNRN